MCIYYIYLVFCFDPNKKKTRKLFEIPVPSAFFFSFQTHSTVLIESIIFISVCLRQHDDVNVTVTSRTKICPTQRQRRLHHPKQQASQLQFCWFGIVAKNLSQMRGKWRWWTVIIKNSALKCGKKKCNLWWKFSRLIWMDIPAKKFF